MKVWRSLNLFYLFFLFSFVYLFFHSLVAMFYVRMKWTFSSQWSQKTAVHILGIVPGPFADMSFRLPQIQYPCQERKPFIKRKYSKTDLSRTEVWGGARRLKVAFAIGRAIDFKVVTIDWSNVQVGELCIGISTRETRTALLYLRNNKRTVSIIQSILHFSLSLSIYIYIYIYIYMYIYVQRPQF